MRNMIYNKLKNTLLPVFIEVIDESYLHKGHLNYVQGGETHFKLIIASKLFHNLSRIDRERKIHAILKDELNNGVHSLQINLMDIDEWEKTTTSYNFSDEILRAYDIRGTIGKNLTNKDAYFIGKSFARAIEKRGLKKKIAIAYDGRISSPELNEALISGLMQSGAEIIHLGLLPTPALYFATFKLNCDAGIMITGSHNPPNQNGFKIMLGRISFFADDIRELAMIASTGDFIKDSGVSTYRKVDIKPDYIQVLLENALKQISGELKIAWDPGNGASGEVVKLLSEKIPGEHILINEEIDGNFPAHHPDPTVPDNLKQLIQVVKSEKCDLGIAFDGDGDRIGAVDNEGRIIPGDQLLLLMASDLLKRQPGAKIIADVKTGDSIFNSISKLGGNPIMWKTGHSFIKDKMKKESALLGGEMSGHMFFAEDYYGFDDAIFAACKLINILASQKATLNRIIRNFPKNFSTPEIRIEVPEENKFRIIDNLKKLLTSRNITFNDLDGIRVTTENGWWLIRASNTQNILVVRVESDTWNNLIKLSKPVLDLLTNAGVDHQIKQI
jgi:phosphomannomutase